MPYASNKIIINNFRTAGDGEAIAMELDGVGKHLAEKIEAAGLAPSTRHFKDEMRKLCQDHAAADRKYLDGLRNLFDRMEDWLDDQLDKQAGITP